MPLPTLCDVSVLSTQFLDPHWKAETALSHEEGVCVYAGLGRR
jgi:hypothetical protein